MMAKPKEISLGDGFGDVIVRVNGVSVDIHADGSILARTKGPVAVGAPANDPAAPANPAAPKIGDKMPDGTVYAGTSPDTGKRMYATPADAPLTMKFNEAEKYAAKLDAHDHQDWRVPTKDELNVLFNNRAAIGGFDVSGSTPFGWYWSASSYYSWNAWDQRFSDGYQNTSTKVHHSSVRCVRS